MGNSLKNELIVLGFKSIVGTTERPGMIAKKVKCGPKFDCRFDHNQGVFVVYDEDGNPWINLTRLLPDDIGWRDRFVSKFNLTPGAYVPHSNDGGQYTRVLFSEKGGAS